MKKQEKRPVTLEWIERHGSAHIFASSDKKAIEEKAYALYLRYVRGDLRSIKISH